MNMPLTKEDIFQRMQQSAIHFWNIKSADELDPMIRMMMEALSMELFQLHTENKNGQQRLLDRVAQMMVPDYMSSPIPSRSLMHARSIEASEILQPHHHFFLYKKEENPEGNAGPQIELCFTPLRPVKLSQLQTTILLNGQNLFQYNSQLEKQQTVTCPIPSLNQQNRIWLGLSDSRSNIDLAELSFYCKISGTAQTQHTLLHALPMVKCFVGGKQLNTRIGFAEYPSSSTLLDRLSTMAQLETEVTAYYERYFITILDSYILNSQAKRKTPFDEDEDAHLQLSSVLKDELHWICFEFPPSVRVHDLQELEIYSNIFPCVNRKLKELKHKLPPQARIVPLRNDNKHEQFLCIHSVSDDAREYQPSQYLTTEEESGLFSIVQGGIEKFDDRNAKEHIQNLLELLRSESAAFASMGYDFVASTLRELQQKMTLMEQKTSSITNSGMESDHYLVVQPQSSQSTIHTEYWLTTGAFGNNIRSHTKLQARRHSLTTSENTFLLQTTHGGRNRPQGAQRLQAFRSALLSRGVLITQQDIRTFCEMELGEQAKIVSIQQGYAFNEGPGANYHRTIDITLQPRVTLEAEEWQQKSALLKSQLTSRSSMHHQYRIFIDYAGRN